MHANYFVNMGGASSADVRALIAMAQARVQERYGATLETEVKLIGMRGEYLHG
jgi:UDP-N-acetylmuramate dehydrogenase